ncbi:MAG: hypothetical protein ACOYD7_06865 [Raoultibacter sp.]|jgi:type IV pilus assembly protein PilM
MFKRAGFKLCVAMPVAAALQNLLQEIPYAQGNCCIVDFSYTSTVLHFFTDASYDVTRTIEVGLLDIDREIANEKSVDVHVAASYRQNDFQGVLQSEKGSTIQLLPK